MPERDGPARQGLTGGPLLTLAHRLLALGPPSLSALIARLGEAEDYEDFVRLIREFLPEQEREILREATPIGQIASFASHFQDRYFPLDDSLTLREVEGYSDLTRSIPAVPQGFSYDDYHDVQDLRIGLQLMTYLVENPFGEEDGARVALAESCAEHVSPGLLERVPEGGLSPGEAHRLLDKTPHAGVALWADIIWSDTGNFFLDVCCEDLWSEGLPEWERESVEDLTRQWQQAEVIHNTVFDLVDWLEGYPPARFEELLNFILERRGNG